MKLLDDYPKVLLGINQEDERIYLYPPQWQDWYWSFGWIGNVNLHTQLQCVAKPSQINDYFKYFVLEDEKLWIFLELVESIYLLKQMAELYQRGSSHIATNPCKGLLQNPEQYEHINRFLIPKLIDETYKVLL